MIYDYIITAFKVIVGVITPNRLALGGLIALGIMLIWVFLSLVFSFQGKFASRVKQINHYISRAGISGEAKQGLDYLVSKMPSEFQRGYKNFNDNTKTKPSDHIKRFESLDIELSGGVFNQNKSIIKTYMNFIFVVLLTLSLAILSTEDALTGYMIAESALIPLIFLGLAKIMYYLYTAIRQHQYKVAVEEFNDMIDNFDTVAASVYKEEEPQKPNMGQMVSISELARVKEEIKRDLDQAIYESVSQATQDYLAKVNTNEELSEEYYYQNISANPQVVDAIEKEEEQIVEEKEEPVQDNEEVVVEEPIEEQVEEEVESEKYKDNFSLNFSNLLEGEEEVVQKRGRGRPRKEVSESGELVIKNDKEFESALVRAEKLMRKNEEPLSASQTKRIEKQIKELVDAMTKYKEGK